MRRSSSVCSSVAVLVRSGTTWELVRRQRSPSREKVQALIAACLDTLAERKAPARSAVIGRSSGRVRWRRRLDAHEVRMVPELQQQASSSGQSGGLDRGEAEYAFWHLLTETSPTVPRAARIAKHRAGPRGSNGWPGRTRITRSYSPSLREGPGARTDNWGRSGGPGGSGPPVRVASRGAVLPRQREGREAGGGTDPAGYPGRSRILRSAAGCRQLRVDGGGPDELARGGRGVPRQRTRSAMPGARWLARVAEAGEPPGSSSSSGRSGSSTDDPEPRVLDRPEASGRRARPGGPQRQSLVLSEQPSGGTGLRFGTRPVGPASVAGQARIGLGDVPHGFETARGWIA
jgi:hypothetical protein